MWVKIKPPGDRRFWSMFLFTWVSMLLYLFLTHSHMMMNDDTGTTVRLGYSDEARPTPSFGLNEKRPWPWLS